MRKLAGQLAPCTPSAVSAMSLVFLVTNYFLLAAFTLTANCYGMGSFYACADWSHLLTTIDAQQVVKSIGRCRCNDSANSNGTATCRGLVLLPSSRLTAGAILGATLADDPYRLASTGTPNDRMAVMHRDSPYSHVTCEPARGPTTREPRFYDKS